MSVYVRAPVVRIYDRGERTVVLGPGGARAFEGDSAILARVVLAKLAEGPITGQALLAYLAVESGAEIEQPEVIDQLLVLLVQSGAVQKNPSMVVQPQRPRRPLRVVLGISGAIAASHSPALVLALQSRGHTVRVAMTAAARRFVSAQVLEAITHWPIAKDTWDGTTHAPVPHLDLAGWAEIVLIHPTSATTLSRLARGDFSDLVSAVALSARCPVVLAPSMNPVMHAAPAVARNVAQLTEDGFAVLYPSRGVEVAEAPGARKPVLGPSPPHDVIIEALEHIAGPAPASWDEIWRGPGPHAWSATQVEPELRAALSARARPGARALDIGTGDGVVARALDDLGMRVVATDLSPHALTRAQAASLDRPIIWLCDDARATKLASPFAVITDRGCLHVLEELAPWAATMRALAAPGASLLVMVHVLDPANTLATARPDPATIAAALGHDFSIETAIPTTLGDHRAVLVIFERAGGAMPDITPPMPLPSFS